MLRRVLLGFSGVFLALGAFEGWSAAEYVRDLRHVRLHGRLEPRTAQEDDATNPYWLEVGARLNGKLAAAFLVSGLGVLWLRSRVRR
ncbi:MAG TPA: hypothetical protein VFD38_06575 [Myxococcaceae bacterium]|nr:hypothetical protein [Myxococcaceae bacterium]